jgi:hypothetical protein
LDTISPGSADEMSAERSFAGGGQAVDTLSEATRQRSALQAALSVEISRLVERLLKGETFDIAASGDELAFRFPDAGMTGAMIVDAVERAAETVGMIHEGALPDTPAADTEASPFDEEIAAAIDSEIGEIVTGQGADTPPSGDSGAVPGADGGEEAGGPEGGRRAFTARGAMAAFRRAFFRG